MLFPLCLTNLACRVQIHGRGLGLARQELESEASLLLAGREHQECLSVPWFLNCLLEARQRGATQPQLTLTSAGIPMQAKYSSTRNMLDADGDTTMSLHSRASTTSHRPEREHTGILSPGVQIGQILEKCMRYAASPRNVQNRGKGDECSHDVQLMQTLHFPPLACDLLYEHLKN